MSENVKNTSNAPASVHEISPLSALLLWPLSCVLRLWNASLRVKVDERTIRFMSRETRPQILVLWHNCLFPAGHIYRTFRFPRKLYAMISSSKDGAYLAMFFRFLGMGAIRGSTKTRSVAALKHAIRVSREGNDIAITPDGSRGPIYHFNMGAAALAKTVKVPVVVVGFHFESSWRLKTWDRMHLPKPFSRVTVVAEQHDDLPERMSVEEMAGFLRSRLMVLNALDEEGKPFEAEQDIEL